MADDGFASFYASSYRRLLGQVFAVTGDLAEAENLLQEAYARAFVRWSRVGASGALSPSTPYSSRSRPD